MKKIIQRLAILVVVALGIALLPMSAANAYSTYSCSNSTRGNHGVCVTITSHWESGWALTTAEVDKVVIEMYGSVGLEDSPGWHAYNARLTASTGATYWANTSTIYRDRLQYTITYHPNVLINKSATFTVGGKFYRDQLPDGVYGVYMPACC